MIDAIYRILYGEDFIVPSVLSIIDKVDRIFICWTDRPWGWAREVEYMGETIQLPIKSSQPYDGWLERLTSELRPEQMDKIITEQMHTDQPDNQFTEFANRIFMQHGRPDTLICMEPDHVWREEYLDHALREFTNNGYRAARSRQIELWKSFGWRVPERPGRTGTVFWNLKGLQGLPQTKRQAEPRGTDFMVLGARVHNLGFCVSEKSMLQKHLIALAYAKTVRDSSPGPEWFERKWKAWTEENQLTDLEIAQGYESHIPKVVPFSGPMPETLDGWPGHKEQERVPVRGETDIGQPDDDQVQLLRSDVHMDGVSEEEQADVGTGVRPEGDLPSEAE